MDCFTPQVPPSPDSHDCEHTLVYLTITAHFHLLSEEDNGLVVKQQVWQEGGSHMGPTADLLWTLMNHFKIQGRLNPQRNRFYSLSGPEHGKVSYSLGYIHLEGWKLRHSHYTTRYQLARVPHWNLLCTHSSATSTRQGGLFMEREQSRMRNWTDTR